MALIVVLAILMVSTVRYTSMKAPGGGGRSGFFIVLGIAAAAMGIWFYSRYALVGIATVYVSHGVIWWIARLIGGKLRPRSA